MASVNKRRWTRPDGSTGEKWIVRYLAGEQHKQRTFARKKEADAFRLKIESSAAQNKLTGVAIDATVAQAATEYGIHNDRRFEDGQIKRGSHRNLVNLIANAIMPHLGKMRMADVDGTVLERWFYTLREVEGLSARTAMERLIGYATFWTFAKRRKLVSGENPASEALAIIGKMPRTTIRTITANDLQRLLAAASERRKHQTHHSWRVTQLAVHLAAFSGLRIGEILALRLCDVDLTGRRVHVRHTLNDWDELTEPKTRDSRRVVPIPQAVATLIADYIRDDYTPNDREIIIRTSFGRGSAAGGPIVANAFGRNYWQPLVEAAGLGDPDDGLHFHALRHFAASWWLQNRMPITEASRLLGHSSPTITLGIYSHAIMEAEERASAIDTMSAALIEGTVAQKLRTAGKSLQYQ
jgi:integrase